MVESDRVAAERARMPDAGLRRFVELRDGLGRDGWRDGADRELARAAEAALVDSLDTLPSSAVAVAIGGFGRGSLALRSDVDLLVLSPEPIDEEGISRAVAPFRDAAVRVACALHTPASARALAGSRLDAISLFLTARPIIGDRSVFDAFWSRFALLLDREYGRIVEAMAREEARRRTEDPYRVLAVDLKAGRGGLRTLDMIDWRRRLGEAVGLPATELPSEEAAARDLLTVIRSGLHAVLGPSDRLSTAALRAVAGWMGLSRSDLVVRRLRLARTAERLVDESWPEVGRILLGGDRRASLPEPDDPALAAAVRHARRPERHPIPPAGLPGVWTESDRAAFLALLAPEQRPVLDRLLASGWMESVFPELDRLFLTAADPPGRTSVGGHTLSVLDELSVSEGSGSAPGVSLPWAPRRLRWAALLHAVGVPLRGADPDAASADLVRAVLGPRLGLDPQAVALVEHLVRHQRVLLRLAIGERPGDDEAVSAAAEAVGDLPTLRLLHSLTVAEIRTGGGPRRRLEDRVRRAYRAVERELWRSG